MQERIVLLDEDGKPQEFLILATFGLDDDDYAALMPADNIDSPTYILRMERDEDGELILAGIDDDEELEDAIAAYEEMQKENLQ
ncbi:DUF1292 domain-containing protein [Tissierella sp. MB52-C2]|jgi:uncharacterized protein YrzB (UPF0473 family)|uniref:DUF1292 domain-containing protein n=1 Tax=Tissierella sp. MB52-C2 TaxID=3070999 RepID=UPI00280A9524|nr:DUF1292 domain-containing protein [Tissierella sp. MB52-C2]WMM23264.1 DUF1292 domain-containing protein [Tissierella sp. MB52-C2]